MSEQEISLAELEEQINVLYEFQDSGGSNMVKEGEKLSSLLPDLATKRGKERAHVMYLKAKALDLSQEHNPDVESLFQKALKLNASNYDAWNCLGHCMMKKADFDQAGMCFDRAMKIQENKISLRLMSMLLRMQKTTDDEERRKNISSSVERAKKAVSLDVRDPMSWYMLGNAYLVSFFDSSHDSDEMTSAFKAYRLASADEKAASIPDLHYNLGTVHRYQMNFGEAIKSYRIAQKIDPEWEKPLIGLKDVSQIVMSISSTIEKKGGMRPKRFDDMCKGIKANPSISIRMKKDMSSSKNEFKTQHEIFTHSSVKELEVGNNPAKYVATKIIGTTSSDEPQVWVAATGDGHCVALGIYNMTQGALKIKDDVHVLGPSLINLSVTLPEKDEIEFSCLLVSSVSQLIINGETPSSTLISHSTATISTKS